MCGWQGGDATDAADQGMRGRRSGGISIRKLDIWRVTAVLVQRIFKNQMVKTPTTFFPNSGLLDPHTR